MLYYAFIHALWHAQEACHDFAISMITFIHLVQFSQAIECDCSFSTVCLQLG